MASDDEGDVEPRVAQAVRLFETREYAAAIAILDKLVLQHPNRSDVYFQRAMGKRLSRDKAGAIVDLTRAIEYNPHEPAAFFFRGQWRIECGDYSEAIMDLNQAIAADEALNSAYYADAARFIRAVAYFLSKQFDEAEAACETVAPDAQTYLAGRLWRVRDLQRK